MEGKFHLTAEGAHSLPRILHVADVTGKDMERRLIDAVLEHTNITVKTDQTAIDLLTTDHSSKSPSDRYSKQACFGAYVFDNQTRKVSPYVASFTVLATGGVGGLYMHTTNSTLARGDGIAMARRVGARIVNMEYIQFHPTGLYHPHKPRWLLTEALRGEGAVLINQQGKEFMKKYHPLGNLAPRGHMCTRDS